MNVYDIVTDRILQQLEKGSVPWRKPWGWPMNYSTKQEYRGINVILLACASVTSPYWLTFKQTQNLGGKIRKGAKAHPIVFFDWIEKKENDEIVDEFPILRYYGVFNAEDVEGITFPQPEPCDRDRIAECNRIVAGMPNPPKIQHFEPRAYYRSSQDLVNMPNKALFRDQQGYYASLFHELSHSTGHASRLNRHKEEGVDCRFGSESYAREELVAEIGAAFLCARGGIENLTIENHAAYVASWIAALQNDKRLITMSAGQAQKAVDYILGRDSKGQAGGEPLKPQAAGSEMLR